MSRRWIIVKHNPKTAICPGCKRERNRLSVYSTPEGLRCWACLHVLVADPDRPVLAATAASSIEDAILARQGRPA